jgi:hypothetical protein
MTTYQNFWNAEIQNLIAELGEPNGLHENIVDTLNNSGRTQIFSNQIVNALRIGIAMQKGETTIALVASMQSGKSGTVNFLCNYVLPAIGFINKHEHILFVTSMSDKNLYDQNCKNLQKEVFDINTQENRASVIKVMKMREFFNHPNPHKVVKDFKVKLVVRDEDQYGAGVDSSFDTAFFANLRQELPKIKLLAVSATPYDILDAHHNGDTEIELIEGVRPDKYYGISEMLRDGLIEDLPYDFRPLQHQEIGDETVYNVHPAVLTYINHLTQFDTGLGIIRESNTNRAIALRDEIRKLVLSQNVDCLVIGSSKDCDFSISLGLEEIQSLVQSRGRRVILIIVQALSAGKDLKMLKEHVRFGIEPRSSQLANGSQGIAGRLCGYHSNRSFKLMASLPLLEHYARFEQDPEIFVDSEWRNELHNANVRSLTTQSKFQLTQKAGLFVPIKSIDTLDYDDMIGDFGREKLSFLSNVAYERLVSFFKPTTYDGTTRGIKLHEENVTIRLSSSYNNESNRVHRNWNFDKTADFGNVFFKKNEYNYGILISNFPKDDPRNELDFTGIKVFQVGQNEIREQHTDVDNNSMYGNKDAA